MDLPSDLRTGFGRLDDQHLAMLRAIEGLLEGAKHGDWEASLRNCVGALKDYSSNHFELEQELMQEFRYPDRLGHEAQHVAFREEISVVAVAIERSGASAELAEHSPRVLIDFLLKHLRDQDRQMVTYRNEHGADPPEAQDTAK